MVPIAEYPDNPTLPSRYQYQVTTNDTNPLNPIPLKGIKIGSTAGNLVYEPFDNPGVTITLPVAAFEHVRIVPRIIKTASTAAVIVAMC